MREHRMFILLSLALVLGQLINLSEAGVRSNNNLPAVTAAGRQPAAAGRQPAVAAAGRPASAQTLIPTYLGCYIDQSARDLDGAMSTFDRNNTVQVCADFCWRRNFKYAGVQFSRQCFCGNRYGTYGRAAESDCRMNCTGDSTQVCGGSWRMNVYALRFDVVTNTLPYNGRYIGCFRDNQTRDLSEFSATLGSSCSVAACVNLCYNNYMQFAAVQNGNQCFCTNSSYGRYGKADESECSTRCAGNPNERCGGSWRNSVYQLDIRPNPCNVAPSPCGRNAICRPNTQGVPICSCPTGRTDDGMGGCCNVLTCTCWGDPHCKSFDGAPFDFMGRCKYNYISTDCKASVLPQRMVPFNVSIKQENRDGVPNARNVAFIRYVEVNVFGIQYRLLKMNNLNITQFSVNGVITPTPYTDRARNISAIISSSRLRFTTGFSLSITWDGRHRSEISLCDSYSNYVCGLCGNADGRSSNDYVDPNNKPVILNGTKFTMYHEWGSTHRVYDDSVNSIDINNSTCNPVNSPGTIEGPNCRNTSLYQSNSWCGAIVNRTGVWDTCLRSMDLTTINMFYDACFFDVCVFEGNRTQRDQLCIAFQKFNDECISLGLKENKTWQFDWRTKLGCPLSCGANQVYEMRAECPKTCLEPAGNYPCGALIPFEACYCAQGFVLSPDGRCVDFTSCGCNSPLGTEIMPPGSSLYANCTTEYFCNGSTNRVEVRTRQNCSRNGYCEFDSKGIPSCYCNSSFSGDGYNCVNSSTTTSPRPTTTEQTTTTPEPTTTTPEPTTTTTTPEPTTTTPEPTTTTPEPTTTTTTPEPTTTTPEPTTTTPEPTTTTPEPTTTTPEPTTTTPEPTTTTPEPTTTTPEPTTTTPEPTTTTPEPTTTTPEPTTTTPEPTTTTPEPTTTTPEPTTTTPEPTTTTPEPTTTTPEPLPTTTTPNPTSGGRCQEKPEKCFIYGDPHYVSLDETKFSISDDCTYLIASDSCNPRQSIYQIFAVHEYRYNAQGVSFLGKILIIFGGKVYEIDNDFKIDDIPQDLPYSSNDVDVTYNATRKTIKLQTKYFVLSFDNKNFFQLSRCNTETFCGLCGLQLKGQEQIGHTTNTREFLVNDSSKSYCASNNPYSIKNQPPLIIARDINAA